MGRPPNDARLLIGKRFNYFIIISDLGLRKSKYSDQNHPHVKVLCDCGTEKEHSLTHIINGRFKSCGCKRGYRENRFKHGMSGKNGHPLYRVWATIKTRCYNKKHPSYKMWGAKGVRMCKEWKVDFMAFYNWCINNGWQVGMEIDKDIKAKKGFNKIYSPETCSIVTGKENLKYREFKKK